MQKLPKLLGSSILVVLICNLLFTLVYMSSVFIPKDKVIESLRKADSTGVLKTPLNSIERSTTGLGIDYGTECAAISIGLKNKTLEDDKNKLFSRFYDGYLVSGQDSQSFDPCSGLKDLISESNASLVEPQLSSYARNWWGISVFIQLGIFLFGLASVKSYLFIATIIFIAIFYYRFSKLLNDYRPGIFLLAPLILFGDFQEIHNSFPYSLYTIQIFTSALAIIHVLSKSKFSYSSLLISSIVVASVYNFMFWFGFHIVVTFVCATIFLILFEKESYLKIYKVIFTFLTGYIVGFVATTVIKWLLSIYFFGSEVSDSIKIALQLRLSSGTDGLNGPLLEYSSVFSNLPVPVRAIMLNLMVFASKLIDPRNASILGIVIISILCIGFFFWFYRSFLLQNSMNKITVFAFLPIFLIPYFYIFITANHSFNHAVLVYRAIPVSLGFALSLFLVLQKNTRVEYIKKSNGR